MVYDDERGVTVLFGGSGPGGVFGETWEWNGTTWTLLGPVISPPSRFGHALAYDEDRSVAVLFAGWGGALPTHRLQDTWEWNGDTWSEINATSSPLPRDLHAMAYDCVRGETVVFGGVINSSNGNIFSGETWGWNGANWTLRHPESSPSRRAGHAIAYQTARETAVFFGGHDPGSVDSRYYNDTWEWTGTAWDKRAPVGVPTARSMHAMAYDSKRDRVLLFGGQNENVKLDDTWEWNGTTWSSRVTTNRPAGRIRHAMAFDIARERVVLFGGASPTNSYRDDTWEWDGTNWNQAFPAVSPPGRLGHSMAFDASRAVTVLFGGRNASGRLGDVWEWNGTDWVLRNLTEGPSPRESSAMTYDERRDLMILFGGFQEFNTVGGTWELSTAGWASIAPVGSPAPRSTHAMAYDVARCKTLLFGGIGGSNGSSYFDDTWIYTPPCIAGDANADGSLDAADVIPFASLVCRLQSVPTQQECAADMNNDNSIDGQDIQAFVAALIQN